MTHPDDGMLLAYVRHQPDGAWPGWVEQHITTCSLCKIRCADYRNTSATLERLMHAGEAQSYPSLVDGFLQQIQPAGTLHVAQPVRRMKPFVAVPSRSLSVSVGIALVLLFVAVIGGLAYKYTTSSLARPATPVKTSVTALPTIPSHKVPTSVPTVPATPQIQGPTIQVCSVDANKKISILYICGAGFTPGSHVALIVSVPGKASKQRKAVSVQTDGTMQDKFYISCYVQSVTITAVNTNRSLAERSQVLQYVSPNSCTTPSKGQ